MEKLKEQYAYIGQNLNLLDEDGLTDIVKAINEVKVRDYVGYYPGESRFFGARLFDYEESLEYNKARFDEWLKKNYNGDKKLFLEYANNNSLFWHYYLRISDNHFSISQIEYSNSNLFYFLRYIILGVFDEDYAEANKIGTAFKHAGYVMKGIKIGDQSLDVKVFKNGRLDIKGLTPKQLDKVRSLIQNKKNSHVNPNYNGHWGYNH